MIRIQQIEKLYGNNTVLKGVTLELLENKIYGLVGENGSGKTTLFECVKNLTKYKGHILLDNTIHIGYLPTSIYFYPNMKAREYIEFCMSARKVSIRENHITEINKIFELPLEQCAVNYSTGMKKKLAFMALLLQKNNFFLLDEPFNGLDLASCLIFKHILLSLINKQKNTILLSSHIISSLTDISDSIFHLSDGVIKKTYTSENFDIIEKEITHSTLNSKLACIDEILIQ